MSALAIRPKVGGLAIGGQAAVIFLWMLRSWAHLEIPPEVEQSITILIGMSVAYLIKEELPTVEGTLKQLVDAGIVKPIDEKEKANAKPA